MGDLTGVGAATGIVGTAAPADHERKRQGNGSDQPRRPVKTTHSGEDSVADENIETVKHILDSTA